MSIWFRGPVWVAVLSTLALAALSAPAAAQPLTGELFDGEATFSAVKCNPDGMSTFKYTASGTATGPFPRTTSSRAWRRRSESSRSTSASTASA